MKKPLYYYVDHTSRFAHNSGIQRCVRALANALLQVGQPLIPVVWDREQRRLAPAGTEAKTHLARWSGPPLEAWSEWPRESNNAPEWLLIVELVSGPHNPTREQLRAATQPLGLRLAWMFHDAIPVRWSALYGTAGTQAAQCHATYMAALAGYERVFCNSFTTREHLLNFLKQHRLSFDSGRIQALPLAEEFGDSRPEPRQEGRARPLELLCVSTLEPRKNHRNLLKALSWLHSQGRRHWRLQLVGWAADRGVVQQVQRAKAIGLPLHWHGRADDATLKTLYEQCDLTVYPSLEEGFGLPVAESLWQRRPCLCSGSGALGERTSSGGCLTVNTADWREISVGLERLLMDPALRLHLSHQADQRPFRRWNTVAQELLQSLERPE